MPRYTDGYREFDHYWCTSDSDEYELVEAESGGERVERKGLNNARNRYQPPPAYQSMKTENAEKRAVEHEGQDQVKQLDAERPLSELTEDEKKQVRNAIEATVRRELSDYLKLVAEVKEAMNGYIGPSPPASPSLSSSSGSSIRGVDTSDKSKPTLEGTPYGKFKKSRKDRLDGSKKHHELSFKPLKSPTVAEAEAFSNDRSQDFEDVPLDSESESWSPVL